MHLRAYVYVYIGYMKLNATFFITCRTTDYGQTFTNDTGLFVDPDVLIEWYYISPNNTYVSNHEWPSNLSLVFVV